MKEKVDIELQKTDEFIRLLEVHGANDAVEWLINAEIAMVNSVILEYGYGRPWEVIFDEIIKPPRIVDKNKIIYLFTVLTRLSPDESKSVIH